LIFFGVFTFGATTPIGAGLIGLGAGVSITTTVWASVEKTVYVEKIITIYRDLMFKFDEARKQIGERFQQVLDLVENLYQQGKIDADTRAILKDAITQLHDFVIAKLNELENETAKAIDEASKAGYEQGYKDAQKDYMMWIGVAGVGGFLLGYMTGRGR